MMSLGSLPDTIGDAEGLAVSANGSVVAGFGTTASGEEAFIWDETHGMRAVDELLAALGLDVAGWSLERATAISSDGLTITGTGVDPGGVPKSWVATLPEPGTGGLLTLGLAILGARRRRRQNL